MPPLRSDWDRSLSVREVGASERDAWDAFVGPTCGGVLMQTWGWGELRRRYGWQVLRLVAERAGPDSWEGALAVLHRRLGPGGARWAYAPRGPALIDLGRVAAARALLLEAARQLRRSRVVALRLDPEWEQSSGPADILRRTLGLRPARFDVQHRDTWVVDLRSEEATLAGLPPSTRRNIRLASSAGVEVETGDGEEQVSRFYQLHLATARRQGFQARTLDYYRFAVTELAGTVFLASLEGEPLAAAVALTCGPRLVYLYGGTSRSAPQSRASYALHWAVIRWGIARGCNLYDMWGIPRRFDPADPAHGYAVFKTRWGGRRLSHSGLLLAPLWGPLDPFTHRLEARLLRRRPLLT